MHTVELPTLRIQRVRCQHCRHRELTAANLLTCAPRERWLTRHPYVPHGDRFYWNREGLCRTYQRTWWKFWV